MLQKFIPAEKRARIKRFLSFIGDDVLGFLALFMVSLVIIAGVYAAAFIPLLLFKVVLEAFGMGYQWFVACVFGAILLWVTVSIGSVLHGWIARNWESSAEPEGKEEAE